MINSKFKTQNFKKIGVSLTICAFVTLSLISLSGCALLTSLFSPVTALDFEKRPNYAVNKSLHLWKDMKSEKIDLSIIFKNKELKRYDSYKLNSFYNNDGLKNSEFKFYYNDPANYLRAKGNVISNYSNDFINLSSLSSNDYLLTNFPQNQWIELDVSGETPSKWLNLLSYDFSKLQKNNFWNILKSSTIFKTESSSEGQLHDKAMFIFDVELNLDEIKKLISKISSRYRDFLSILLLEKDINIDHVKNIEVNRGKIWINKESFITEKILVDIDILTNNAKQNLELTLDVNPNFVSLEEIKIDDAVSLEVLIDDYTKNLLQETLPVKKTEESFIKQLEKAVIADSSSL